MTPDRDLELEGPALKNIARGLHKQIKMLWPHRNLGFAFLIYDFGADGHLAYTSNGNREDMKKMLRECLEAFERGEAPYDTKGVKK